MKTEDYLYYAYVDENKMCSGIWILEEEVVGADSFIRIESYDESLLLATYDEETITFTRTDDSTYTPAF